MNKKGFKTTVIAVICLILGIITFGLWFWGKLDNEQLTLGLASIATFGTTIGLFLAKDATASHTFDGMATGGHPDPSKEEK